MSEVDSLPSSTRERGPMTSEQNDAWTDEQRAAFIRQMPTYQRYDAMRKVREAARLIAEPGDLVLYRDAFRWHDDKDDMVMSNHYECQSIQYLGEEFGYEILHDFRHVAVVRRKR